MRGYLIYPISTTTVAINHVVGRVAAQSVAAYPPGAGILQPGEVITQEAIAYLLALEAQGSRLKGVAGRLAEGLHNSASFTKSPAHNALEAVAPTPFDSRPAHDGEHRQGPPTAR